MAVAQDRAVVLEATQLGVETTPGLIVGALKRLSSVYIEPIPNVPITMHRAMGSYVATGEVMEKQFTAANLSSTDFNFRELIYLLSGIVGAPVGGGPLMPLGATRTQRWVFRLINWAATNPQTYTVEHGQNRNGFAERFGYGLINTLACRTTEKDLSFSGQVIGQALIEAVTITQGGAALANPTTAPVLSASGTATGAGTLLTAPTVAPSATAVGSGGTLAAGVYGFEYTYTTAAGETTPSPVTSPTVVANGSVTIGAIALPANATGINWYASDGAGSYTYRKVATAPTTGAGWTFTAAPATAQPVAPTTNTATYGGSVGTTNLAAGTYTGGYTLVDVTGETADVTSTVTILAGQAITFAPIAMPVGATVKYYLSPAAGNTAIQFTGIQNTGQVPETFTTLPATNAGAPPATSTTTVTTVTQLQEAVADPSKIAVWSGNTIAGLVQHSRTFDSEWSMANRFGTIMTQDDRTNTYSAHVDKAPDIHVATSLQHDAFSQGLMADLLAKQPKYLRWIVTGALIEAGFPFRCQMTMPAFLDKPTRKAQGDVYGADYEWVARDDPSFGAIIEFVVDTDQGVL